VTVADCSAAALASVGGPRITTRTLDLQEAGSLEGLLWEHDLVVGAVPGPLGFETLRRVIEGGRDAVDISFFPEDALELDALARQRGVRVVVDAGLAPGLGNLILGHLEASLESTESFSCVVGGLPVNPTGIWQYRAPFSPMDVLGEYTRPARFRRGGEDQVQPALEELESVDLPGVATLEAFLTDGLRTLLQTSRTPNLVEKTLRYPGHAEKVRVLRESGFLDEAPLEIDGVVIRPLDLSVRLLERAWAFADGEEDLTVMRVVVEGREGAGRVRHVYDLFDRYDPETGTSSMARTTGYTCGAIVRWLAQGRWNRAGVAAPETLAREGRCLEFVLARLTERGVRLTHRVERLQGKS
jgi:saccharopine dehydrogenase-like NADP-dependent oxidoreductase